MQAQLQAYKFELIPTGSQRRSMAEYAGSCRFVYNKALALERASHEAGGKYIGYNKLCNLLPAWKVEHSWLKDCPAQTLQQALKNLHKGYERFFKAVALSKTTGKPSTVNPPVFKRKFASAGFRFPDPKQFTLDQDNHRVKLPKLGWMGYRCKKFSNKSLALYLQNTNKHRFLRTVKGELKNVTLSLSAGKWFFSVQTESEVQIPVHPSVSAIGIDVGITNFAAFSDGTFTAPLDSFKKHKSRLARYQRRLSRKVKNSCNFKKARRKVQRIHHDIANARSDFLHKLTTAISKNHAVVSIEDLKVKNMSRSARGTTQKPGVKVAQKKGLNRAILDQGWGEFRRQLGYKLARRGGMLIAVAPHYTSQECPQCHYVARENRCKEKFFCLSCGFKGHADTVGAMNIHARGQRAYACGGSDGSGVNSSTAVRSSETGTCRSDLGNSPDAVGIPAL